MLVATCLAVYGHVQLYAGSPASQCFDASIDEVFFTTEIIPLTAQLPMPQVEYAAGHPTRLIWGPLPEHTSTVVKQIGRYMDKGIWRVDYTRESKNPDGSKLVELTLLVGLEEPTPNGVGIRPFFIDVDEDIELIREIDSTIFCTKALPFALEIERTQKGTGVYTTVYTFVFNAAGANILTRSTSGRETNEKTYYYNKSGKITKIETTENR